jgi:hypothetical protein
VAVDRATPGGKNSYSAAGAGIDEHQRHVARESRAVFVHYRAYPDLREQLLQTGMPASAAQRSSRSGSRSTAVGKLAAPCLPRKEVVSGPTAGLA